MAEGAEAAAPKRKKDTRSYIKRGLNYKLSGNEVDYTACSLLVILKNSCSKLHRQSFFFNSLEPTWEAGGEVVAEGAEAAAPKRKKDTRSSPVSLRGQHRPESQLTNPSGH